MMLLITILINCTEPLQAQTAQVSVNDLITIYNSDISRVKSILVTKGFKLSYDGDKFGKVQFYQWYHGRTSHNADAFLQRYIPDNEENYNWFDDCLEFIVFSADAFQKLKRNCVSNRMQLVSSGLKDFTYDDSYIRDPGSFCIYQSDRHWMHFNAVQEADKMVYKVLVRKKPE